jgi:hypothetical protein
MKTLLDAQQQDTEMRHQGCMTWFAGRSNGTAEINKVIISRRKELSRLLPDRRNIGNIKYCNHIAKRLVRKAKSTKG